MIWGAANYMIWKGYSAWLGMFALLLVPGLLILACFPKRNQPTVFAPNEGSPTPSSGAKQGIHPVVVSVVSFFLILGLTLSAALALPLLRHRLAASEESSAWTTVVTDPPKFSIAMPGVPRKQTSLQDSPAGHISFTTFQSSDGTATYSASFIEYPPDWVPPANDDEAFSMLDKGLDDWMNQFHGCLVSRSSIAVGGYPGREQRFECESPPEGRFGRPIPHVAVAKAIVADNWMAVGNVVLKKEILDRDPKGMETRMARFFDSLTIE